MEKDIGSNSSLNSSASDDSTPIAANSTGRIFLFFIKNLKLETL